MLAGLSPEEFRALILSVGTHRSQRYLSPMEVAVLLDKARTAGTSLQDCAAALHLEGSSMVSRFIRLLGLAPEVKTLVDWGSTDSTIAFSAASELARISIQEQIAVAESALKHRMSSSEIKELVQIRKRSQRSIEECIDLILQRRPQIITRNVIIGKLTDDSVMHQIQHMNQQDRDRLLGVALTSLLPTVDDVSCRLGPDSFVLTGNDKIATQISTLAPDPETAITEELKARIASESSW